MLKTVQKIGPQDHGRRMSLKEFEPIQVQEGYLYELGRGVIVVSDVPGFKHLRQVSAIRDRLVIYKVAHPHDVYDVVAGSDCKILIAEWESERHPDLSIFKKPPPSPEGKKLWWKWIADIAIEVVSRSSRKRDYVEKREEYLTRGVKEYWIVDGDKKQVTILRRVRGKWVERVLHPGDTYETDLLPGFQLSCQAVFEAAKES
jgi:Uma2 family endonuclease